MNRLVPLQSNRPGKLTAASLNTTKPLTPHSPLPLPSPTSTARRANSNDSNIEIPLSPSSIKKEIINNKLINQHPLEIQSQGRTKHETEEIKEQEINTTQCGEEDEEDIITPLQLRGLTRSKSANIHHTTNSNINHNLHSLSHIRTDSRTLNSRHDDFSPFESNSPHSSSISISSSNFSPDLSTSNGSNIRNEQHNRNKSLLVLDSPHLQPSRLQPINSGNDLSPYTNQAKQIESLSATSYDTSDSDEEDEETNLKGVERKEKSRRLPLSYSTDNIFSKTMPLPIFSTIPTPIKVNNNPTATIPIKQQISKPTSSNEHLPPSESFTHFFEPSNRNRTVSDYSSMHNHTQSSHEFRLSPQYNQYSPFSSSTPLSSPPPALSSLLPTQRLISLFIGTWNMHAKPPPPMPELSKFIPPSSYDIYVIGTEECEQSIEKSLLLSTVSSPKRDKWNKIVLSCINGDPEVNSNKESIHNDLYVEICSETLVAMHICAYARKSLSQHIRHIESGKVATGIGDRLGNKGGVGICFYIGTTSFLFINSHFAAHQAKIIQRNADYHKINNRLRIGYINNNIIPTRNSNKAINNRSRSMSNFRQYTNQSLTDIGEQNSNGNIVDNDINTDNSPNPDLNNNNGSIVDCPPLPCTDRFSRIFWFGDLNYRIEGNRRIIEHLIKKNMFEVLLANDQLLIEKRNNLIFQNFCEHEIKFAPTYKLDAGISPKRYDSSKKKRIPGYTDRILWKDNYTIKETNENTDDINQDNKKQPDAINSKEKKFDNPSSPSIRGCSIYCHEYKSIESISTSDHFPVCGVFSVMVEGLQLWKEEKTALIQIIQSERANKKLVTDATQIHSSLFDQTKVPLFPPSKINIDKVNCNPKDNLLFPHIRTGTESDMKLNSLPLLANNKSRDEIEKNCAIM